MSSEIETFPHQTIPSQPGMPTYETIQENEASIQSELGGGAHGLLGLALSPTAYQTITGSPFVPPVNPGTLPAIPALQTGPQINEFVRAHNEDLRVWREYIKTERALKTQLLNTFDDIYFKGLRNRHTGYATTTLLQLI